MNQPNLRLVKRMKSMIKYFPELIQGSDPWLEARRGLLTASEMKLIITPKELEYAQNEKEKSHLYELAAQRINQYVEPSYIGDDMLRGIDDESYARETYHEKYAPVETVGFVTSDEHGEFVLGYSPDGLVGDDGQIECKSRKQKYQLQTIVTDEVPEEYAIQLQTGLLVTGRAWCDFISYCGGMPMFVNRVYPDEKMQAAIKVVATIFHEKLDKIVGEYSYKSKRFIPTERRIEQEMFIS